MGEVSTIGLGIAKSAFQIHGVDASGAVVIRKRITRAIFMIANPLVMGTRPGRPSDAPIRPFSQQ